MGNQTSIGNVKNQKWGVMVHLLEGVQNNPEHVTNENIGKTSWEELINGIDVEEIARELHEMGAGWLLVTLMQTSKYMISPNETYNKITQYAPGEACSTRDLPMELYEALKKYDIDLWLYYTGDGPCRDEQGGEAMGLRNPEPGIDISENFIQNWASVLKEYAERYAGKAKRWWLDGCYKYFGYTDDKLKIYHDVLKNADKNYMVAYNDGNAIEALWADKTSWRYEPTEDVQKRTNIQIKRSSIYEEYSAGEVLDFTIVPQGDEEFQWHILSPLSGGPWENCGWADSGVKYTEEYFSNYLQEIWGKGGIITIEMGLKRSGKFFDAQKEFVKKVVKPL